jgi:hypothetical protein
MKNAVEKYHSRLTLLFDLTNKHRSYLPSKKDAILSIVTVT